MATEMLGKKEDLHEVDWVKQQTKSALSSLQKEVLYTKNGNEVKFDVDTSLKYLKTLKDKKSYKEVMAQNAGTTVMAVQILLKNKGYNVGKIDGILRGSGKATSNTMEAIKKFQRDNGLKDDGAPGPDTIKKILAVYETGGGNGGGNETVEDEEKVKDLTKAEFEALCEKTSLTDEEIKQVVKYSNEDGFLFLNSLENLNDQQCELLSKAKYLRGLTGLKNLTDKQAEFLSKVEDPLSLDLDGLTTISAYQCKVLCSKRYCLNLGGLVKITEEQAKELGRLGQLRLNGVKKITEEQAEELGKVKDMLSLYGLTSITDKQAENLSKVETLFIKEDILTQKQKEILKNRFK